MLGMLRTLFVFIICCFVASWTNAADVKKLRGQRYCEVLIAYHRTLPLQVYVYNTIGLNLCPEKLWHSLSTEEIKRDKKAYMVKLNGPRVWVIDGMKNSTLVDPSIVAFNGLQMHAAAILQLSIMDLVQGQKPYTQHRVKRNTTWVYEAGRPIYELIDPAGKVYVMQSYSLQKQALSLADLKQLHASLKLPGQWQFRMRIVQKTAFLTPMNGLAIVIQDDLLNTYQMETPSFQP